MSKKYTTPPPGRTLAAALLAAMLAVVGTSSVYATQQTWDGAASGIWDTSALNWGGAAFTSSNDALFTGAPTNNVTTATGLTIGAITLDNTFTGSVTMSGANTVSGATTISGGTLNLNNATGLGTSAITVNSGGTAAINVGSATVANAFSGAGILNTTLPSGNNSLTLSGDLSGFTGTLNVGIGSGGGKLVLSNASTAPSSSATINVATNGTLFLFNPLSYGSSLILNGGTTGEALGQLRIEGGATWTGGITLNANSTIGGNSTTGTISGVIAGSGFGFTKVGASTLVLSNANTYTGTTTINAGTLDVTGTLADTGAVNVNGGTYKVSNDDTVGAVTLTNGTISNATGKVLTGSSYDVQNGTVNGILGGSGIVLTKSTAGTVALNNANTYTGGTTINAGTITFTNASAFGTGTITSNGGTIRLLGGADLTTTNNLVVNAATTLDIGVLKNWTFNGNISGSGDITRGTTATTSMYLGGDNSGYTGTFTIQNNGNSIVRFAAASAGSESAKWVFNNSVAVRADLEFVTGTIKFGSFTGTGQFTASNAGTKTIEVGNLGLNETFSGVLTEFNTGVMAVNKVGTGTWTLSGASLYTGATTVTGGTLSVSSLANGGSNSNIGKSTNVADNLILNGGTLQYTGAAASTDRLFSLQSSSTIDASGSGAVNFTNTGAMGFNGGTAAKTLMLTGTSTGANTLAAAIGDNTGATSVSKSGAGTWVLSGGNTYTGATTVNAGTLKLTGSIGSSSVITIAFGATFDVSAAPFTVGPALPQILRGAGAVTGAVDIADGSTVAAGVDGSTIGTLTFSSTLTGTLGSIFSLKLDSIAGTADLLTASGTVTLGSATLSLLDIGSGAWTGTSSPFSIIHGSSISGTFTNYANNDTVIVGSNSFTLNYTGTDVTLTFMAIPEPSTYAALAAALVLGAAAIRRRRQA